ncbi:MAG: hypothetical protein NVSMB7_15180 [Chitinophagaceae bacterium]
MSYTVVLLPQANNEAQDAANYYEEQKDGLGSEFLDELEAYLKSLLTIRNSTPMHLLQKQ